MSLGPRRTWNAPPQFATPDQQDFATWVMNSLQDLQGPVIAPTPPRVATIPHPGAVQIVWNEQNQATAYAIYETSSAIQAPGVPITTIPANMGAQANSFIRGNLNDTTTRYYSVVAITQFGRSIASTPVAGAALSTSAGVIPVSQVPVNQNGVGGGFGGGGGLFGVKPGVLGS